MLTIALCVGSCKTRQIQSERVVTVTERDTMLMTMPDSASIHALMECDSLGNVLMRENGILSGKLEAKGKNNAKASLSLKNNVLEADCECDTLAILAKVRDTNINTTNKEVVYKEKDIPMWMKVLACLGVLFIVLVIIKIWRKIR